MARRAGMTLGEFLNQLIRDSDDELDSRPQGREERRAEPMMERRPAPRTRLDDGYMSDGMDALRADAARQDMARLSQALEILSDRVETAERRAAMAITGVNNSVAGVLARLEMMERGEDDLGQRLERMSEEMRVGSQRLSRVETEQSHDRHAGQLKALEAAVGELSLQLQEGDIRAKAALADVREHLTSADEKIAKVEAIARHAQAGASAPQQQQADPQILVELAVSRLAPRLEAAETRSREALSALASSLEALEERLMRSESQALDGMDALQSQQALGLKQLAEDLSGRLEAARMELGGQFEATLNAQNGLIARLQDEASRGEAGRQQDSERIVALERALFQLNTAIGEAEKRSAGAVERMGHEVLRIAQNLNGRMGGIETRGATLEARLGGDMRRLAEVVESRFQATEATQGQALERLGGEIARLSEKLTQRITDSERRTSFAVDEVSERFIRTTSQIEGRQERLAAETQSRLQAIESEVQSRMGEVKAALDARLNQVRQEALEERKAVTAAPAPREYDPFPDMTKAEIETRTPAQAEPLAPVMTDEMVLDLAEEAAILPPSADEMPADEMVVQPLAADLSTLLSDDDKQAIEKTPLDHPARSLAEAAWAAHDSLFLTPRSDPAPVVLEAPVLEPAPVMVSPSEGEAHGPQIEDAPVFADVAKDTVVRFDSVQARIDDEDDFSMPPVSTREALEKARESSRMRDEAQQDRGLFRGLRVVPMRTRMNEAGNRRPEAANSAGIRKTWVASTIAASAVLVGGGILSLLGEDMVSGKSGGKLSDLFALEDNAQKSLERPAKAPASKAAPLAASLLTLESPTEVASEIHRVRPSAEAASAYDAAMVQLNAGRDGGVKKLISAANLGHPDAQLTLGQAYAEGQYGLKKSPADALRWFERAAKGGSLSAMQELGVSYFYGKLGLSKDPSLALSWLQAAASRGYVDAQVNLAMIYEGRVKDGGVTADPKRALAWYMIAAQNGDKEALKLSETLKASMNASDVSVAQQAASGFKLPTDPSNAG